MTSAAFVQNDTEPETTGTPPETTTATQPDAPLSPRVQQVADIFAEARARRIRGAQS